MLGGVFFCASAVAFARQPQIASPVVEKKLFETWIPSEFGQWKTLSESGVVLPPPDALSDRLYDNLVTRVFASAEGAPVMMLLAYNNAQDGVLQVHRPEVCYPVGGYQLTETTQFDLATKHGPIPANFFTATGPDRVEQVVYFTRMGDAFPRSWLEQRVAVMKANLGGDIPDGVLLRVSSLGPDTQIAVDALTDFTSEFIDSCDPKLRRLLIGTTV
jgi:EpsI family protein